MSYTYKARTIALDNVSRGQATGQERTIAGAAPNVRHVGGIENIAVGQDYNVTSSQDNQQVGVVTIAAERVAVS